MHTEKREMDLIFTCPMATLSGGLVATRRRPGAARWAMSSLARCCTRRA